MGAGLRQVRGLLRGVQRRVHRLGLAGADGGGEAAHVPAEGRPVTESVKALAATVQVVGTVAAALAFWLHNFGCASVSRYFSVYLRVC